MIVATAGTTESTDQPTPHADSWQPNMFRGRMGVARADITPPVGIQSCVWGASTSTLSTGIHRPLTVTAIAIESDPAPVRFIVTADIIGLNCHECDTYIRTGIIEQLGIELDDLLLHSTHTHAAPRVCIHGPDTPGSDLLPDFREKVLNGVIEACQTAKESVTLADVTWDYGHCDLAVNRDLQCGDTDIVGFNPDGNPDDTIAVGRITDASGTVIGVLVNYACHPTTLAWENLQISPDFVGSAREIVEDVVGAPMAFFQGASGELSPRHQYTGDTSVADTNGRILGYAVLSVVENMEAPGRSMKYAGLVESGAPLATWTTVPAEPNEIVQTERLEVPLGMKILKTIEELRAEWANLTESTREERIDRATRLRDGYRLDGADSHPVWIWQLGDAVFVAQPGEAYSYFQTELRRRHPEMTLFVLNLTNGRGSYYLPTHHAYVRRTYQSWQSLLAPGAVEQMTETVDERLNSLLPG